MFFIPILNVYDSAVLYETPQFKDHVFLVGKNNEYNNIFPNDI